MSFVSNETANEIIREELHISVLDVPNELFERVYQSGIDIVLESIPALRPNDNNLGRIFDVGLRTGWNTLRFQNDMFNEDDEVGEYPEWLRNEDINAILDENYFDSDASFNNYDINDVESTSDDEDDVESTSDDEDDVESTSTEDDDIESTSTEDDDIESTSDDSTDDFEDSIYSFE